MAADAPRRASFRMVCTLAKASITVFEAGPFHETYSRKGSTSSPITSPVISKCVYIEAM